MHGQLPEKIAKKAEEIAKNHEKTLKKNSLKNEKRR